MLYRSSEACEEGALMSSADTTGPGPLSTDTTASDSHSDVPQPTLIGVPPVVALIDMTHPKHPIGMGSGFVFDTEGHVATDAHVVESTDGNILPRIAIKTEAGDLLTTHIEKLDDLNDIAVIKIDVGTPAYITPVKLAETEDILKASDPVRVWGYPEDAQHAYIAPGFFLLKEPLSALMSDHGNSAACYQLATTSYFSRVGSSERQDAAAESQRPLLVASMRTEGGMSGGPAVLAINGTNYNHVIGIQDLGGVNSTVSRFTPVSYLRALMSEEHPKFTFTYKKDPVFINAPLNSQPLLTIKVQRTDGEQRPPYHFQLSNYIREQCYTANDR
jgi:hypothetical protein